MDKRIFALALLLISVSFVACTWMSASILTYDPIPEGTEKGYVEFFSPSSKQSGVAGYTYLIREKSEGRDVDAHPMPVASTQQKRRIAKKPGTYTFIIRMGSGEKEVTLDIKPNMIKPVKVIIQTTGSKYIKQTNQMEYSLMILFEIGEPIPRYKKAKNEYIRTTPLKVNF